MVEELEKQIKVVAEARDIALRAKDVVNDARADWEEEHINWFDTARDTANAVSDAETLLHKLTLQAYAETGNKAPAPGVGIREVTKYAYDSKEALSWAIEHKMALKLDEAKFKNHVKADPPDFVTITTEPQATISTKL